MSALQRCAVQSKCCYAVSVKAVPAKQRIVLRTTGSGLLFARSTGLTLWPSARLLSEYLAQLEGKSIPRNSAMRRTYWTWVDKTVVELGCGLALCSIVSALLGSKVVATDGDQDVVALASRNLRLNCGSSIVRHPPRTATLPWGDESALARMSLEASTVDAVLLSDVVYGSNPGVWQRLISTLLALSSPDTLILQAETERRDGQYEPYWEFLSTSGFSYSQLDTSGIVLDSEDAAQVLQKVTLWLLWRSK